MPNDLSAEADQPPSWLQRLKKNLASFLRQKISRFLASEESLRDVVAELVEEPTSQTGATPTERLMLANVLELREKTVADCMLPRASIVAVELETTLQDLITLMTETQHSRIPVYRDTLDDVLGMVHMKDVLDALAHGRRPALHQLLRQVLFVPPTMPLTRLLMQMRQSRHHMAMVVDEYGGIDGLVTIEDLVEEIVGEIDDEHDDVAQPRIVIRADGSLIAEARLTIDDFEERVGPFLSEDERAEIDTLGGLVFLLAGRLPQPGETFTHPAGFAFDVLELEQNRVKRVRVRDVRQKETAGPAAAAPVAARA